MSCPNATAPKNISLSFIGDNYCDLKCAYSFSYADSTTTGTNRNDYIQLSYDRGSSDPVVYNKYNYYVDQIRLYTPSLHAYNGQKTDAEMIIVHLCAGQTPLLVCVPIRVSNYATAASQLLTQIVETMSANAPVDGESTQINLTGFNLSKFVPKKPYFSYSGTIPYQDCTGNVDYIVFNVNDAAIDITSDALTKMKTFILENIYDIKKGGELFYNENGPGSANGNEIYIDCKPTGADEENTKEIVTQIANDFKFPTLQQILANPFVQMILSAALFILILAVFYVIIQLASGNASGLATTVATAAASVTGSKKGRSREGGSREGGSREGGSLLASTPPRQASLKVGNTVDAGDY